MLQLTQSLGFNLPNALTRNRELLTNLFQRVISVHTDTKAHTQNALFTRRE